MKQPRKANFTPKKPVQRSAASGRMDELLGNGSGLPPRTFGIYEFWSGSGERIYVGKAIDLRARLSQYRKPKRGKKGAKVRRIVAAAAKITWNVCLSELDALEKELRIIQEFRPSFNQAGAFSFMYPYLGMQIGGAAGRELELCFTTTVEQHRPFEFWGAYRSRILAAAGFEALTESLSYLAHRSKRKATDRVNDRPYSIYACFRQMEPELTEALRKFLLGDRDFLANLAMRLLEKPQARRDARLIQDHLLTLEQFFDEEIVPLMRVCEAQGMTLPVEQKERDILFLRHRHHGGAEEEKVAIQCVE